MKFSLGISNFLEEISSLSHSVVLLNLFARSLREAFLSLLATLWNSAFKGYIFPFLLCLELLFFSQLFVRPPKKIILSFCISLEASTTCLFVLGASVISNNLFDGPLLQSVLAAKSLQSCPTLCDPTDFSPPGSPPLRFSRQ